MKRKVKQRWSTIPPISTKRTITFHLNSLYTKKTTSDGGNPGPGLFNFDGRWQQMSNNGIGLRQANKKVEKQNINLVSPNMEMRMGSLSVLPYMIYSWPHDPNSSFDPTWHIHNPHEPSSSFDPTWHIHDPMKLVLPLILPDIFMTPWT
jgi:hypothetical protein